MNLYELFILGVNIKYIVSSILYRHINVPMACKELTVSYFIARFQLALLTNLTQTKLRRCSLKCLSLLSLQNPSGFPTVCTHT